MTITNQDLHDWKANPVTKEISKLLQSQVEDIKSESCLRDTADQTAMQVARNEGIVEGIEGLNTAYDYLIELSEGEV